MSRSILLQLVRDSIEEVFQAQRKIDKQALLQEHPLLNEKIPTRVNLLINHELLGSAQTPPSQNSSLIDNIIISAKKAAFEDSERKVITISQYLHCDIELILSTPDGVISEIDPPLLQNDTGENIKKS